MTMVSDGDDHQHGEGEKRALNLLARLRLSYGDEETRTRRGKRKIEHECENQQNPNYRHDYASSSSSLSHVESKRRRVVSEEPIRAEPIREIKPNRHDASCSSLSSVESKKRRVVSEEPIKAEPIRVHDASSWSFSSVESKKRRVVSDEPIRAEPIRVIKKPVRVRKPVRREPVVTPGWVIDLIREKKGADVKLIIEKTMTPTDLDKDQSRFSMPFNQMWEMDFLTEAELNIIDQHFRKIRKKGVDVILVDSFGEEWMLNLRKWRMKSTFNYSICTGWYNVVQHHQLEIGQIIRLWSFHSQDGMLYFAFSLRDPAQAMVQPQAPDPDQAMAQPQAPDPDQAMALALFPLVAAAMAPVETIGSEEVYLCEADEERNRINVNLPEIVCVPAPSPTPPPSRNLGQRFFNFFDELATLEAEQETHIRMGSLVSVTETTTLDLELRL